MRGLRPHLTYANIMVTLLAIGALTGGVAYAADTIGSSDIINGQVKSVDIGTGQVQSIDVKDGQLNDEDVGQAAFVNFSASIGGPDNAIDHNTCENYAITGINA